MLLSLFDKRGPISFHDCDTMGMICVYAAEALVQNAYRTHKIDFLLQAIEECKELLLPNALGQQRDNCVSKMLCSLHVETDIFPGKALDELIELMCLCSPGIVAFPIYYSGDDNDFAPIYKEEALNSLEVDGIPRDTKEMRKLRNQLWSHLVPFISSKLEKRAKNNCLDVLAALHADFVDFAGQNGYRFIDESISKLSPIHLLQGPSSLQHPTNVVASTLNTTGIPLVPHDFGKLFREFSGQLIERSLARDSQILKTYDVMLEDAESVFLGAYLLCKEDAVWAQNTLLFTLVHGIGHVAYRNLQFGLRPQSGAIIKPNQEITQKVSSAFDKFYGVASISKNETVNTSADEGCCRIPFRNCLTAAGFRFMAEKDTLIP